MSQELFYVIAAYHPEGGTKEEGIIGYLAEDFSVVALDSEDIFVAVDEVGAQTKLDEYMMCNGFLGEEDSTQHKVMRVHIDHLN